MRNVLAQSVWLREGFGGGGRGEGGGGREEGGGGRGEGGWGRGQGGGGRGEGEDRMAAGNLLLQPAMHCAQVSPQHSLQCIPPRLWAPIHPPKPTLGVANLLVGKGQPRACFGE